MTEYIIVYKPRGRPVNYPYRLFKQIGPPSILFLSLHTYNIPPQTGAGSFVSLYSGGPTFAAQQFLAPPSQTYVTGAQFGAGRLYLSKTGSPTGTVTVTLRADSGSNTPGTTLATVATFDASTLGTSAAPYTWEIPAGTALTLGAKYWLVVNYSGGNSTNTVNVHRTSSSLTGLFSATSTNGTSWTTSSTSWFSIGARFRYIYSYSLSFPYTSAFQSAKRISQVIECLSSLGNVISGGLVEEAVQVNATSVAPPLVKETAIPQATSYTLTGRFLHKRFGAGDSARFTTVPYLYFTDPDLNVEDLGASEAYLLRIVFAENGSILRVNGLVDSDLYGDANTVIDFADLAIPVRRLEWISGSGECTLLVID
jgi:hypothetical protein